MYDTIKLPLQSCVCRVLFACRTISFFCSPLRRSVHALCFVLGAACRRKVVPYPFHTSGTRRRNILRLYTSCLAPVSCRNNRLCILMTVFVNSGWFLNCRNSRYIYIDNYFQMIHKIHIHGFDIYIHILDHPMDTILTDIFLWQYLF